MTFGDIVFAKVDGNFFGYFFATKVSGPEITIKRVPLTGGTATVLATLTNVDIANSSRNLLTDGVNLYWQDDSAVRKIPIRGGPVTVLDPSCPNTPTAGLALQNGNIIYGFRRRHSLRAAQRHRRPSFSQGHRHRSQPRTGALLDTPKGRLLHYAVFFHF